MSVPAFPSTVSRVPCPERVFYALLFLRGQKEFGPDLAGGGQRLRRSERPQHCLRLVETGNHPAPQAVIKFNAEIAALNLRLTHGLSAATASEQDVNNSHENNPKTEWWREYACSVVEGVAVSSR